MSRITFLNEDLEISKIVIMDSEECAYKTNCKCINNRNMRWLGKVCRRGRECEYYKEEEKERGEIEWSEEKR